MMNSKESSPEEYAKYLDELVSQVKTIIKPGEFSDEEVLEACKAVSTKITEMELMGLVDMQSRLCDRCATCCKTCTPIDMTNEELNRIMKRLGMKSNKFLKKFKITWSGDSDVYHMKAGPCPFLKEPNICTIYDIRPAACSGFPALPMMSDAVAKEKTGGTINILTYCHVVKSFNAYRAAAWMMQKKNPEMSELVRKRFEPLMQELDEQLSKTSHPGEQLRLQYEAGRKIKRLFGLTEEPAAKPDDAD